MFLYFLLAALPTLLQPSAPPETTWEWIKLFGMTLYQGLLAIKAYQSPSPQPEDPAAPPVTPPLPPAPKSYLTPKDYRPQPLEELRDPRPAQRLIKSQFTVDEEPPDNPAHDILKAVLSAKLPEEEQSTTKK